MLDLSMLIRNIVLLLVIALVVTVVSRRISLPYTLGLVVVGMVVGMIGIVPEIQLSPDLVLFILLPALLFEGAWSVRLSVLRENWRVIFFLAGPGLLLSLGIIAALLHFITQLDWTTALLLAAILSPTDPVAVLGLFRQLHVNERLATIVEGESLFNDGIAGALYKTFLALVLVSVQGQPLTGLEAWQHGIFQFLQEAGGGALVGGVAGYLVSHGLKRIDDPVLETTATLICAYGVYWVADVLHTSAIIAVIVAGLLMGSYGRAVGISEHSRDDVDTFWRMLAFLGNAFIFLLIGVQIQPFTQLFVPGEGMATWLVALVAVGVVLLARFVLILVLTARSWLRLPRRKTTSSLEMVKQPLPRSWHLIIFWSGLRGALSLALALALPQEVPNRDLLLISTYAVVFFTLLVQGLSVRWVLTHIPVSQKPSPEASSDEEVFTSATDKDA